MYVQSMYMKCITNLILDLAHPSVDTGFSLGFSTNYFRYTLSQKALQVSVQAILGSNLFTAFSWPHFSESSLHYM
jgi:hypothetical protein